MAKSLIRTIDRWRFERPLGLALGAATLFALLAMPASRYAALPLVGRLVQPAGAALVAVVLALAGWFAMRRPVPAKPRARTARPIRVRPAAADTVRLRRADRHPDAPARAPIRAHRDLGSPFMEVDTAPPAPPVVVDMPPPPAIDVAAMTVAAPVAEEATAPVPEVPVAPAPVATIVPMPAPARNGRTDLDAMIDRLAAGLAARATDGVTRRPPPALLDALGELNRIAAHRG